MLHYNQSSYGSIADLLIKPLILKQFKMKPSLRTNAFLVSIVKYIRTRYSARKNFPAELKFQYRNDPTSSSDKSFKQRVSPSANGIVVPMNDGLNRRSCRSAQLTLKSRQQRQHHIYSKRSSGANTKTTITVVT